ncbi:hypothetical protein [Acidocella sp.]|uniref:hypothetical protein n=1 Tax=Acidocella sp. TaxID=50710 RepID=UPI003CFE1A90
MSGIIGTSRVSVRNLAYKYYARNPKYQLLSSKQKDAVLDAYIGSYFSPLDFLVLGDSKSVWTPSMLYNFRPAGKNLFAKLPPSSEWVDQRWKTDPSESQAAHALNDYVRDILQNNMISEGSVLYEMAWSLLCNDAFVRGAIDTGKEVHVAQQGTSVSDIPMEKLFDEKNLRPRVLGRELLSLGHNGYDCVDHDYPNLGVVFIPRKTRVMDDMALDSIYDQINTKGDMLAALKESFRA